MSDKTYYILTLTDMPNGVQITGTVSVSSVSESFIARISCMDAGAACPKEREGGERRAFCGGRGRAQPGHGPLKTPIFPSWHLSLGVEPQPAWDDRSVAPLNGYSLTNYRDELSVLYGLGPHVVSPPPGWLPNVHANYR